MKRRLKYVQAFIDEHGRPRFYFRRRGYPRVTLPSPSSEGFWAAYSAAMSGDATATNVAVEKRAKPGSLQLLAASYYASHSYGALADSSKATYRRTIEKLCERFGELSAAAMQRSHVKLLMDRYKETPEAANQMRKVLRCLMQHAVDVGLRADDPTCDVKKLKTKSDGHHSWTEDEIAKFEAVHPVGSTQRPALGLLLYLGQRREDTVLMGRQHLTKDGRTIRVKQHKTGRALSLPIHSELAKLLNLSPTSENLSHASEKLNLTFLLNQFGTPFTPAGFSDWFRKACDRAGLPHCSAHGLRKPAARRLADAGCSTHEIASITGHASLREIQRYTEAASQAKLADAAMAKLGTEIVKPATAFDNEGKIS
jgi:integrase